jgi:MFS family permease
MQTTALGWLVLHLSGNKGAAVGLVLALRYLPTAILSAWAGVLADRFDKWRLLLISQGVVALCAAGLAVVDLTGVVELWIVLLLVAGSGLGTAFDMPVRNAFVMEMVGPRDVVNAVGLNSAVFNGARMFGPALAGIVIVAFGTGVCFLVNALSFVVVITMFFMMRTDELHRMPRAAPAKGQVWDGLRIWEPRVASHRLGGRWPARVQYARPSRARKLTFHGARPPSASFRS